MGEVVLEGGEGGRALAELVHKCLSLRGVRLVAGHSKDCVQGNGGEVGDSVRIGRGSKRSCWQLQTNYTFIKKKMILNTCGCTRLHAA